MRVSSLDTVLRVPANASSALLFIHGWGGDIRSSMHLAEEAFDRGYASLAFNLRGHGRSTEDKDALTRQEYLANCVDAYDILAELQLPISVVGASFGGYLAACLAGERSVQAVALRAPALFRDAGFSDGPPISGRAKEGEETRATNALAEFGGRLLVVESSRDSLIPRRWIRSYLATTEESEHLVLRGASHSISTSRKYSKIYSSTLFNWLAAGTE